MRIHRYYPIVVSVAVLMTACTHASPQVQVRPPEVRPTTTTTITPKPATTTTTVDVARQLLDIRRFIDTKQLHDTQRLIWIEATTPRPRPRPRPHIEIGTAIQVSQPASNDVVGCIYAHESGNYAEHSHLGSGSGAAQFIPSTWRTWSARAGHAGYAYAYQAPPAVQDAVLQYTLTHGGSHNWDPKFGNDPCTVGLP